MLLSIPAALLRCCFSFVLSFFALFFLSFLVLSLLISPSAFAASTTLIRDYSYKASENDSKVSARKAALQQLQLLAIEEVGVEVKSTFNQSTQLQGEDYQREVQASLQTFAQAVTRTKILEETWDGEIFYIKAEIILDPDGIKHKFAEAFGAQGDCKAIGYAKLDSVLEKPDSLERSKELISLSKTATFDNKCNIWQADLFRQLVRSNYPVVDKSFKEYIFAQLKNATPEITAWFIYPSVEYFYASNYPEFTQKEWDFVLELTTQTSAFQLEHYLKAISLQIYPYVKDRKLESTSVANKLFGHYSHLAKLASEGKLGKPAISEDELAKQAYRQLDSWRISYQNAPLADSWFIAGFKHFANPQEYLAPTLSQLMRENPTSTESINRKKLDVILTALANKSDEVLTRGANYSALVDLLLLWDKQQAKEAQAKEAIDQLKTQHGELLIKIFSLNRSMVSNNRTSTGRKLQKLLIEHEFANLPVCQPSDCARQLFSNADGKAKHTQAEEAADLLLSYGKQALSQQELILRKLERLIAKRDGYVEEELIAAHLFDWIAKVELHTPQTMEVLLQALQTPEASFVRGAEKTLISLYPHSLEIIFATLDLSRFEDLSDGKIPLALIRVLGKMPKDPKIATYLKERLETTLRTDPLYDVLHDTLLFQN